jgi:hypothetical protein
MVIAEAQRLLLRCFHVGDLDAMAGVFADPEERGSLPLRVQASARARKQAFDWTGLLAVCISTARRRLLGFGVSATPP